MTVSTRTRIAESLTELRNWGASVGAAFRASLDPRTPGQLRLVDQQLAIARSSSSTTTYILPVAAMLIAYANRDGAPLDRLIAWPLLVAAACIGCDLYFQFLSKRIDEGSPDGIRARARTFTAVTFITSLAWASMIFFLWEPSSPINHMFLILIIACTISGWGSMGASHLASAMISMPVHLAAVTIMPISTGVTLDWMLAGLSVGFWVIMAGLLSANYQMRTHMLKLENERGPLIDDLKSAKEDSDRARVRAETASRAKSSFLANMSHELRTPLNAILGFSEIIHTRALGAKATEQYAEYGGFIHDSGRHLLTLINDILDLARIEAGRMTLREEEVDLARLLSDSTQMLSGRAAAAGIQLDVEVNARIPNVYADERAIRQIIVNLLSNALKFTPAKGRVSAFANVTAEGAVCFGVSDTGVGIELEDQTRVFESFGQGRHDAVIADQGTGLGLPIVKGLVEIHGGAVALESVPGKGTRVTVTLPAERSRARRAAA